MSHYMDPTFHLQFIIIDIIFFAACECDPMKPGETIREDNLCLNLLLLNETMHVDAGILPTMREMWQSPQPNPLTSVSTIR